MQFLKCFDRNKEADNLILVNIQDVKRIELSGYESLWRNGKVITFDGEEFELMAEQQKSLPLITLGNVDIRI